MKKALKWGAIIGGGLLLVIVVALLLIPLFINVGKYKPLIEKRVSDAAGRPVSVGDDMQLSLFPWAGLTVSDLRIGNPPGFVEKDFLTVKSLDVRVRLLPLLSKDIRVQRFILNKPDIVLTKNKEGRGNWEMPPKSAGVQPTETPAGKSAGYELPLKALAVGDFAINNGTALWVDQTTGQRKKVTDISLKLKDVTLDQPIKIAFSGRLDGQSLSLDGKIGPVGKQIGQGSIPLDISLSVFNELKMKLKGQVDNPVAAPRVDLAIDVAEFSLRKLVANLGRSIPVVTADPKVLNRLSLTARIKVDQSNLAVSDAKLKLDDSTLNIMLKVANFSKPDMIFDIALDQIDLDRYLPPQTKTGVEEARTADKQKSAAAGTAQTSQPARNPFNLAAFAVDGHLKAKKVTFNQRNIQDILLSLSGKNAAIKLNLSAQLKEGPLSVIGTVGPFGPQPGQQSVALDITVNAVNELRLQANGKVINLGTRPGIDVAIKIDEFSPRKLLAAFGQPFPIVTSDPDAINRLAVSVRLKADAAAVSLTDGTMTLDKSKMNFMVRAADFAKPDIAFDLSVDQINLDHYLPPKSEKKAGGEKPASGKPAMDYGPLRRLVIDGQLKAGKLTANNLNFQNLLLKISGKNGVIFLDPFKTDLYQGSISGKGNLNAQENVPKTAMNLTISNVKMNPLLIDALQKDLLEGVANAHLDLSIAGDTPEKIKQNINGQGEFIINDGAIKGFDLAAMARNAEAAFGLATKGGERPRTDFTELKIPFTIANGIAETAKSSMQSPFIRLEASGKADLAKETLDFRVDPKAVATIKGQGDVTARSGIMVPIIVSGTFASPKFRPDLKGMITQQIDKGVLESEPAKKVFESEKMKKFEEPAKGLLKDLLKKP